MGMINQGFQAPAVHMQARLTGLVALLHAVHGGDGRAQPGFGHWQHRRQGQPEDGCAPIRMRPGYAVTGRQGEGYRMSARYGDLGAGTLVSGPPSDRPVGLSLKRQPDPGTAAVYQR